MLVTPSANPYKGARRTENPKIADKRSGQRQREIDRAFQPDAKVTAVLLLCCGVSRTSSRFYGYEANEQTRSQIIHCFGK